MKQFSKFVLILMLVVLICDLSEAKKKKKYSKQMILRQKETNPVNFIRLAVMRLIYGVATRVGFGDQISEAMNGVFVPPGADYDYDGDSDEDEFDF